MNDTWHTELEQDGDRWDVPGLRHEASLDERVDEALAKADAILDLI